MSTPEHDPARLDAVYPRFVAGCRWVTAVVIAGSLGALAWMALMQEGHTGQIFGRTWTEHDFPDGLGLALGFEDTARGGLLATCVLGVLIACAYALVERRISWSRRIKGLALGGVIFLLWGLVFTPLINSRQLLIDVDFEYLPTGFFGIEAGWPTIISAIVGSLVTGLVIARVYELMRDAEWWQEHPDDGHGVLLRNPDELFELPEQRTEQRVEGPG